MKITLIYTTIIIAVFIYSPLFAADVYENHNYSDKSSKQQLSEPVINKPDTEFITITIENDFFGKGTDQNYTNGIMFTYFDIGAEPPKIAKWLSRMIPTFEVNDTTSVHYSLGQNLYTPENIDIAIPDPHDRPYAAFLYGSAGFTTISASHIDDIEMTVGIVGPAAQGEFVQANFHELIDSNDPKGWDHQLENELGVMLSWQRGWPELYGATIADDYYLRAMPHIGATLGNIYTYANAGFNMQFLPKNDRWQSQPLRVRPAMPGSGVFGAFEDNWSWMFFAGVDTRFMARNIFLDGNTFRDSPSVDKKYIVADANIGLALTYDDFRIAYTLNWRSEEFQSQDEEHIFGVISLSYRF